VNRKAILNGVRELGFGVAEFRCPTRVEESLLVRQIEAHFVSAPGLTWWWSSFSVPTATRAFDDGLGFKHVAQIAPDAQETIWFVVEEASGDDFGVFETSVRNACAIVGQCPAFEYYLVAKDFSWLICENHHEVVIASGSAMRRLSSMDFCK